MRGPLDPQGQRKRRKVESKRPTYLSRADIREKSQDQLVGEILLRMTPRQFETRCTQNNVHLVLSEQQGVNPLWSSPAVKSLLGKGPRFIPKARPLSTMEVRAACARLGYRLVRTFERYVAKDWYAARDLLMEAQGIQKWTPRQRTLSTEHCRAYVANFFKCQGRGDFEGAVPSTP